ncbi:MAG: hypothetical protein A2527_13435 [Candidatus Lambdaproteobacteria bacterium RIFOXYD2_FULL_50_16]|uniref:LPP20 lipoprotein n=1 Tax=Candidatus Lambdaproteobacteria bacterium RIFOXYD2_FULL_50_16 TaxID=1817772 RepID=A0A1F6G562_9PROT|nr:MAG: hypothetical protein A2527_13435 [Candidatus Lambdaproteobacteria bacterium RIFOXYD2_FULL_50_16]
MKGISLLLLGLLACAPVALAETCAGTDCLPKEVKDSCTVSSPSGCIDWEKGIVYATGMGVPNESFKSAAQKRYSAYQAARVVAQRNLLGLIEDINITSTQTVKMGMLENDEINIAIQGKIKHVEEFGKPKEAQDGSTWVTMRMYLRDIVSVMLKNEMFEASDKLPALEKSAATPAAPKPEIEYGGDAKTIYSGLVIDARGSGIKPAMSPKVLNAEGIEVYGSFAIEREFALEYGVASYLKDLKKAKENDRVKGNPLFIKGEAAGGAKGADVKISKEDGELLKELEKSQAFLREARVIIVL